MVGVPRSRGCLLCVKRRVKCDEARPACGNCTRYGAECPGYDRIIKFVAGKHHVRPRRPREPVQPQDTVLDPSVSPDATNISDISSTSSLVIRPKSPPFNTQSEEMNPRLDACYLGDVPSYFVIGMIDHLFMLRPQGEIIFLAPWFTDIPKQIGRRVQLDSAVCAFTMHLLGKVTGDSRLIGESRSLYGRSLGSLQKALNHPIEWRSAETLCATMILCLFEASSRGGPFWPPMLCFRISANLAVVICRD